MTKIILTAPRMTSAGSQNTGDVIEVDDDEAKRCVAAGQAEFVSAPVTVSHAAAVETASVVPTETAVTRTKRKP